MPKPSEVAMDIAINWLGAHRMPKHHEELARIIDEAYAPLREQTRWAGEHLDCEELRAVLAHATPKE